MVSHRVALPVIDFLASIEPTSLPLLAVLAFSLTLYPLGLMLGSDCSPCCGIECGECETGKLPDTVTVTFDGFPDTGQGPDLVNVSFFSCSGYGATARLLSPNAATGGPGPMATFEIVDPGSGYAVVGREEPTVAVALAGNQDATLEVVLSAETDFCELPYWSVASITVTSPGTGYDYGQVVQFLAQGESTAAVVGLGTIITVTEEPTVTLSAVPGDGAVLVPVWAPSGPDKYTLGSVTVSNGGSAYRDGSTLVISPTGTTTVESPAYAEIQTTRLEPTLTLTTGILSNGGGAVITPQLTEIESFYYDKYWSITGVEISSGGAGFVAGELLIVPPGAHTEVSSFYGVAVVRNDAPTLTVTPLAEGGSGAQLNATLSQITLPDGSDAWEISDIDIENPGSGYADGGIVGVILTNGTEIEALEATLSVDEAGAIVGVVIDNSGKFAVVGVLDSVTIYSPGEFFLDDGIIASVEAYLGGTYYNDTGVIDRVDVLDRGVYYLENLELPALVPPVEAEIYQLEGSNGIGAVLSAVVDDDPESETFGQITGVTIINPGTNYLAWANVQSFCMGEYFNGRPITLARKTLFGPQFQNENFACSYETRVCDPLGGRSAWQQSLVGFTYKLDENTSVVSGPGVSLATDDLVEDCSSFTLNFPAGSAYYSGQRPAFNAVSATVVSGGGGNASEAIDGPPAGSCGSCCLNEDAVPAEITLSVQNVSPGAALSGVPDGDYVLIRDQSDESNLFGNAFVSVLITGAPLVWFSRSRSMFVAVVPCAGLAEDSVYGGQYFWFNADSFPGFRPNAVPEDGCGNNCYKNCRLVIGINVNLSDPPAGGIYSDECNCREFPICSPPPGTYELWQYEFLLGARDVSYRVTIS